MSSFLVKKILVYKKDVPSSYAKIFGETEFQLREFPRSSSKAMSVEERERETSTNVQ